MKKLLLLISILYTFVHSSDTLYFGAITTVDKDIMQKKLTPLMQYLSHLTGKKVLFQTGIDYQDTIDKFKKGVYDLGFIGPAPYIIATQKDKNALKIIAGLNNNKNGYFHSTIVVKKNSDIHSLEDLKGKSFAFGSEKSTLSFYLPMYMLQNRHLDKEIKEFVFLGKHDKVAKYVIIGKYDAGGIKESVANKYSKYLRVIAKSKEIPDFLIVANPKFSDTLVQKIREALLQPEAKEIAKSIKSSATGFRIRSRDDYQELEKIMKKVKTKAP